MKFNYRIPLTLFAGLAIGAVAVEGIHAQAKPPVYYVAQNEVSNLEVYTRDFVPPSSAIAKASGGRVLVQGGKVTALEGPAPKSRPVIIAFDNMEKLEAWQASPEYKAIVLVGKKSAEFHTFAVEGVPQ